MTNPDAVSNTLNKKTTGLYSAEWTETPSGTLQALWPAFVLPGRVVELGAASGRNQSLLGTGHDYIGFEYSQELVNEGLALGRDLRVCDLTRPSDDLWATVSNAQTVLMLDVLEHLPSPRPLLSDIARCMQPGTRWLISVPNVAFLTTRVAIARGRFPKRPSGHFDETHLHHFTRETISQWLLGELQNLDTKIIGTALPVQGSRLCKLPKGRDWAIPAARRAAEVSARFRPSLLAFEWLGVIDHR